MTSYFDICCILIYKPTSIFLNATPVFIQRNAHYESGKDICLSL